MTDREAKLPEERGLPTVGWIASVFVVILVGVLGLFVSKVMAIIAFLFAAGMVLFFFLSPRRRLLSARLHATRLINEERYEEALNTLLRIEASFPIDLSVKTTIALVLKKLGKGELAEERWADIHKRQSTDYAAYYYGKILRDNGKAAAAIGILVKSNPRSALAATYYNLLGCCHMDLGETDRAIHAFERVALRDDERREDLVDLRYNLARALEAKGDARKAIEHYRRIAAIKADYQDVKARLEALQTGGGG